MAIVRSEGFYVNEKSTDTSWDFFKQCLYWYLYVTESTGLLMFLTGLFVTYCT